jgi:hypothetical protein
MKKQKKLQTEEEEYQTPLQILLSFLSLPHKIYRDIYISIIERRLSATPLIHCDASTGFLARQQGIEPALMSEKIQNMVRMKWIHFEQVGDRDSNQVFVISPIWRYKHGIDKDAFAITLREYKGEIKEDTEHQMTTEEIYELMNGICLHTLTKRDPDLCKMARWVECKTCNMRNKEKNNETK